MKALAEQETTDLFSEEFWHSVTNNIELDMCMVATRIGSGATLEEFTHDLGKKHKIDKTVFEQIMHRGLEITHDQANYVASGNSAIDLTSQKNGTCWGYDLKVVGVGAKQKKSANQWTNEASLMQNFGGNLDNLFRQLNDPEEIKKLAEYSLENFETDALIVNIKKTVTEKIKQMTSKFSLEVKNKHGVTKALILFLFNTPTE